MKIFFILAFTGILIHGTAQVTNYSDYFNGSRQLNDVAQLTTAADFAQVALTAEQIDERIGNLMRNTPPENFFIEIPYNSKRLQYVGKMHPRTLLNFANDAFTTRLPHINSELEIFSYDGIYIFLPGKSTTDLLNLFFTLRALTIIKIRYPEAYVRLVRQDYQANALSYLLQTPYRRPAAIHKSNSIIPFDTSPIEIAASTSDMFFSSTLTSLGGWNYFENTHNLVTSIDIETIKGNNNTHGSKPLYNLPNAADNYLWYLRDGLIETLIHEFTHHYISNSTYIDEKAFFINEMRFDATDINFDFDVEEAVVLNTILRYYDQKSGISKSVIDFYKGMLQRKKITLTATFNFSNKVNLQRYYALKALSTPYATNFEDVYFLPILNK